MIASMLGLSKALARIALAAVLVGGAMAAAASEDDLPGRVGRLADLYGRVYLATEERAEDWVEALRNYTVTSGDNLWVSGEGRAEIDYGGGQFRLAGDSNVHVSRLDDRVLALFVAQGRVIVRVRVLEPGDSARIDTPNTQLALTRPGLYRVDVADDRSRTTLVVREGEATVALAAGLQQVLPGQTATVTGTEATYAEVRTGYAIDGFDSWSADRDRRYERSRTASYVSRQMIGYADLDDHGVWETAPEYGTIWYPTTVVAGWAPYRHGRWTWVGGWGWTWVDDAPWGYAPFHYGRWAYVGSRWGWIPGGWVARPVWAPALVGWYGGSGWSFSVSYGAPVYGWVPLGWGEPYLPWWRNCSNRCWTGYNRPYAVNHAERPSAPPTRYTNWSAPGGVTAVAGATFTGRRPVHANLVAVKPALVTAAPVLPQAPVLAKPTAATIPGAKPAIGTAPPPPASTFFRTKPLQVAPAGPAGGSAPTWGGGSQRTQGATSAPPAVARPGYAPRQVNPAQAAPAAAPTPAISAPPGSPGIRTPSPAAAPAQRTWGVPPSAGPSPIPPAAVSPGRADSRLQRQVTPHLPEPRPSAPPAGIPMPRSAGPSTYATPPQSAPPVGRPMAVPPALAPQAPPPRAAASVAPPPPQAAPAAPPPGVRSAPPGKPMPQRDGDKPTMQR